MDPITTALAEEEAVLAGADVGRQVVLGGLQRVIGFVLLNLMNLACAALLLRHLGVDTFGRYGTVMALLTIVQGISDSGLTLTGSRELAVATGQAERRHLLAHLMALRIVLSALGIVGAVAFAWLAGYTPHMVEGTALAGGGVFLLSVQGAMLLPLVVDLRNLRLAVNDVVSQALLVVCFLAFVILGAGLVPFLAAQLIAAALVMALTPWIIGRRYLVAPRWTPAELRLLAGRSVPLAISGALVVVYFRLLVIVISLVEGSARQIGYFVTSERIIEVFLGLPLMLVSVVLPVLSVSARDDAARLRYVTLRTTQMMAAVGMLFAVAVATGAHPILVILGGRQYGGAADVLRVQCFALVTVFITQSWTTTLVGLGHTRQLVIGTSVGVAAVFMIGIGLIIPFGAMGGAIAAVAADLIYCAAVFFFVHRAGAAGASTLGPLTRILASAVAPFALAILSPLPALVNCALATALYLVATFVLGAVPPEIVDQLRNVRGRLTATGRA